MRLLVAPDKFKGTLTAEQAAEAIATGWRRAVPDAVIETVPLADGGEGTLDALLAALGGERHAVSVTGPLGDLVTADHAVVATEAGPMGVVEMARASGLALLAEARRNPRRATTRGTGELILAACRGGAFSVLVCIGGSATNDGGAGMAQALGVRLLDERGRDIGPGGEALLRLARIDLRGMDPVVRGVRFVVATDVDNPLVGPDGAAAVYGPQKGATGEDVELLDRALRHFAAVVHRDLGIDIRDVPGAGAAGGLGAGLIAFLGARLRRGAEVVMDAVGLARRMEGAGLVVTGEGTFDAQSLRGKAPSAVLALAGELRVPAVLLCGRREADAPGVLVRSLVDRFGPEAAMARPRELLTVLAEETARELERQRGPAEGSGGGAVERFERAAAAAGVRPEVRRFPEETRTAEAAARAVGCAIGQIVKSLVFVADGGPFLALTSGPNRADTRRLAELLGAVHVRRADPDEARAATGYAIGGTPPFGHPRALRVVVDRDLLGHDVVWAAAGAPDAVFPMAPEDLVRASGGEITDFKER